MRGRVGEWGVGGGGFKGGRSRRGMDGCAGVTQRHRATCIGPIPLPERHTTVHCAPAGLAQLPPPPPQTARRRRLGGRSRPGGAAAGVAASRHPVTDTFQVEQQAHTATIRFLWQGAGGCRRQCSRLTAWGPSGSASWMASSSSSSAATASKRRRPERRFFLPVRATALGYTGERWT